MAQYNQVTPEIVERLQAIAPGRVYTGADVNRGLLPRRDAHLWHPDARRGH